MRDSLETHITKRLAGQCLSIRIRLLNRLVNSIYDAALRPHKVKASQVNILMTIAHKRETTSKELCSILRMDSSTLSRAMARLRKNKWLLSEPSGDGKILTIKITRKGINKIEEVYPAWEQAQGEATDILGEKAATAILEVGSRHLQEV